MAAESHFVSVALAAISKVLESPLSIKRGAALLYEIAVNNELRVTLDPRKPTRGDSAFQTDLCVFEEKTPELVLPRMVIEFKTRITTHDVITYSAKARKHKQVYPWLRYGFASEDAAVPRRFFVHNDGLDFFIAAGALPNVGAAFRDLVVEEVEASRRLERIAFDGVKPTLFRNDVVIR